jgi:hypothetical protein
MFAARLAFALVLAILTGLCLFWRHVGREAWRFCREYRDRYPARLTDAELMELEARAAEADEKQERWQRRMDTKMRTFGMYDRPAADEQPF